MSEMTETRALMLCRAEYYSFLSTFYRGELSERALASLRQTDLTADGLPEQMRRGLDAICHALANPAYSADELAADFARVFLAAGEYHGKGAYPYESVYTSKKKLVMQEAWEQVRAQYSEEGLMLGNIPSELMEDHLAVELEYMANLCRRAADKPERKTEEHIDSFLSEHLLNWVPQLCEDMRSYARTDLYRGLADLTEGYLSLEGSLCREHKKSFDAASQSFRLTTEEMDHVLSGLARNHRIYAPRLSGQIGRNGQEIVRFGEIHSVREIVTNRQSDFSAKEVYNPVVQTMFYFEGDKSRENIDFDERGILIFAHSCDIHAISRLDNIFLHNGEPDAFYSRRRERIKFILLECAESFENCYCVTMGTNRTESYSAAIRLGEKECFCELRDKELLSAFEAMPQADFYPVFPEKDPIAPKLPEIHSTEDVNLARSLSFWQEYNEKCISCAGCNTVCPTCSCFDTLDVLYDENSSDGERRRVWSGCMLDTFTMTAGGGRTRKTPGDNMRFKTLHKIYDYRARFKTDSNMCVGCGRCVMRCPKDIDFRNTITRLHDELEKAREEK